MPVFKGTLPVKCFLSRFRRKRSPGRKTNKSGVFGDRVVVETTAEQKGYRDASKDSRAT